MTLFAKPGEFFVLTKKDYQFASKSLLVINVFHHFGEIYHGTTPPFFRKSQLRSQYPTFQSQIVFLCLAEGDTQSYQIYTDIYS